MERNGKYSRRVRFWGTVLLIAVLVVGGGGVWLSRHYVVPILMYHQVEDIAKPAANWVSPENFEWQMTYLKEHGFRVISLGALVEATLAGQPLPRKSVVVTFDDGYENNYTKAFPVLKKYGYPATIFMASDLVGQTGRLTGDQLKEMVSSGIDIGSHTRLEVYLPGVPKDQQREQVVTSKMVLENIIGGPVDFLSYPTGGFSDDIVRVVQEAGYKGGCTTNRGYDRYNRDVFQLKRIRMSDKDIRGIYLWMKLSGYYNLLRKQRNPY